MLRNLEVKWIEYLSGDNCPPVLGLAALSDEESDAVRQVVIASLADRYRSPWRALFVLLREFPATISVWVARKAGEAYESGAFWDRFGELVGTELPVTQRAAFAQVFREACRKTMSVWVPPTELGGHTIVAEFLYQAGLPLDRCRGFAQHVRKVERSYGLPDADAPEAGEQLREAVLESLQPVPVPTLKRALRGPAGARICEVALNVVLKGDFTGINPRLGRELETVFASAEKGTLRRSAHQPFLRLGADCESLEIVGPRQDSSLVSGSGVTWVVDGRRFPTPRSDEFLLPATNRPRVVLELAGLTLGALPPRTFVLRLDDLAEPFMLFDERTQRQRRVDGPIPPGNYWLLHRTTDRVVEAEERYDWPDGERAVSFFAVGPGRKATLQAQSGTAWIFTAALQPFFEPDGKRLYHEGSEPVYYAWSELPLAWLPTEETDQDRLPLWHVHLHDNDREYSWKLTRTSEIAAGMTKCRVECGTFLETLPPGLSRFDLALRRGERSRVEAQSTYWYWQGLECYDARAFHVSAAPTNVIRGECRGFRLESNAIRHLSDMHRRHTLTFTVRGKPQSFYWSQPGIFVESIEREVGKAAEPRSHPLGTAFSASIDSVRWLRIWLVGLEGWEVIVGGRAWSRDSARGHRDFVEISLASLAISFPHGGEIRLSQEGNLLLARFSSPLHAASIEEVETSSCIGYRFHFPQPVKWVRPLYREISSGQQFVPASGQTLTDERCTFDVEACPQVVFVNVDPKEPCEGEREHGFEMQVPHSACPDGLWLIELQVRRDEDTDWETVTLSGYEHAPIVLSMRSCKDTGEPRTRLFWKTLVSAPESSDVEYDGSGRDNLFDLLADLIAIKQERYVKSAKVRMKWLKTTVRALSILAGRIVRRSQGNSLQHKFLSLACQDSSHTGFVHLPGLLALPASAYRELPIGDPLNDALRRCGQLVASDTIAQAVREAPGIIDLHVVASYANFSAVAGPSNGDTFTAEFHDFDLCRYRHRVLGTLERNRLAPDWSGEPCLGRKHLEWALAELVRRYEEHAQDPNVAAANSLMNCADQFQLWLREKLKTVRLMNSTAWDEPWPHFLAAENFLEAVPRFATLFALAARTAAAGWLDFDGAMHFLESRVENPGIAEEGIAALVGIAPELFGHELLLWEMVVRTTLVEAL